MRWQRHLPIARKGGSEKLKSESPNRTGHQRSDARGQQTEVPSDEMLTRNEMAAKLKVSLRSIENWQRDGYLPFIKIGNAVWFHWPDVLQHLKTHFRTLRSATTPCGGPPGRTGN